LPQLIIDDKEVEFRQGQTVIESARNAGIKIPHFCWHPGLSISGNCRICLVEIEKLPKLAIACSTLAAEGMVVHTKSDKVVTAQNSVMEFLLINHPLDCPICDEAGECKLQDYAFKYGIGISRFEEEKNHKDKRIELGTNVMFDRERCISCSRCIRFCEEIAKSPQLTFVKRGEKVTIETFPGKKLDNPYSMNVVEICPVGALTSRDFRFKSRVWDMSFTGTICPGCSRGCNSTMGVRNNEILRIEPRQNHEVNDYWLCDWGRLNTIKYVNDKKLRVNSPKIKSDEHTELYSGGEEILTETGWEEAISSAVSALNSRNGSILFIASPFSTLEDNYALKEFAKKVFESGDVVYIQKIDETFGDDILRKSDKTPNSAGLKILGINPISTEHYAAMRSGKYKNLYVINDDLSRLEDTAALQGIELNIHHLNTKNGYACAHATVIFPESTYAEINGTFMNFQGRIQRLHPAVATLEQERLFGEYSQSRLDKFGARNDRWTKDTRFNARPTWKILNQVAKGLGVDLGFNTSEEVFAEFCRKELGIKDMDYDKVGDKGYLHEIGLKNDIKTRS